MFSRAGHSHSASSGVLSTLPKLAGSVFLYLTECGAENFLPTCNGHDIDQEKAILAKDASNLSSALPRLGDKIFYCFVISCLLIIFWCNVQPFCGADYELEDAEGCSPHGQACCAFWSVIATLCLTVACENSVWNASDALRNVSGGEAFMQEEEISMVGWLAAVLVFLIFSLLGWDCIRQETLCDRVMGLVSFLVSIVALLAAYNEDENMNEAGHNILVAAHEKEGELEAEEQEEAQKKAEEAANAKLKEVRKDMIRAFDTMDNVKYCTYALCHVYDLQIQPEETDPKKKLKIIESLLEDTGHQGDWNYAFGIMMNRAWDMSVDPNSIRFAVTSRVSSEEKDSFLEHYVWQNPHYSSDPKDIRVSRLA